jgi:hypothetical protein
MPPHPRPGLALGKRLLELASTRVSCRLHALRVSASTSTIKLASRFWSLRAAIHSRICTGSGAASCASLIGVRVRSALRSRTAFSRHRQGSTEPPRRRGGVIRLLAMGMLNKQIAAELGVSEKTIRPSEFIADWIGERFRAAIAWKDRLRNTPWCTAARGSTTSS